MASDGTPQVSGQLPLIDSIIARDRWLPVWIAALCLGFLGPRIYLIAQSPNVLIDSDEAGSMEKKKQEGYF